MNQSRTGLEQQGVKLITELSFLCELSLNFDVGNYSSYVISICIYHFIYVICFYL